MFPQLIQYQSLIVAECQSLKDQSSCLVSGYPSAFVDNDGPTGVNGSKRSVAYVPIQVPIPGVEPDGVLTQPPSRSCVIPPRPVVLKPGVGVVLPGGELDPVPVAGAHLRHVAVAVVVQVVPDRARRVHQV